MVPVKITYTKAKFWVGLVGAMAITLVQFLPDGTANKIVTAVAAMATAIGVYVVRNQVVEVEDGS